MIKAINLAKHNTSFCSEFSDKFDTNHSDKPHVLPATIGTDLKQGCQRTMSAFIDYPVKGLKGNINSDFYEFLTMGIVPYVLGSGMFMLTFNVLNNILPLRDKRVATTGKKLALGVVMYGLFKNLSKNFVTKPVELATGVNTEMPYENVFYSIPTGKGEDAEIEIMHQQSGVFDSKEFYRKDLMKRPYFDEVAKELGLGEDLNDSISETSPIIQNIVATSNTAKSISSYLWAALGVMLATQNTWVDFFNSFSKRKAFVPEEEQSFGKKCAERLKLFGENSWYITKEFGKSFGRSWSQLWNGNPKHTGFMKHAGKAAIISTGLVTAGLTSNVILKAKNMVKNNNDYTIDKTKESTVI